ncbi:hypothetical protein DVH05_019054 [Phytophthora capsici]|nr:hypothetical protein DVH05_019054 [Phytophthora capsici]
MASSARGNDWGAMIVARDVGTNKHDSVTTVDIDDEGIMDVDTVVAGGGGFVVDLDAEQCDAFAYLSAMEVDMVAVSFNEDTEDDEALAIYLHWELYLERWTGDHFERLQARRLRSDPISTLS